MSGQKWGVSADGGYLANPTLSAQIRHAAQPMMKFRQFVRPIDAFGKGKSDRKLFNKISNTARQGTTINETSKMPETKVTISQGSVIVDEYGQAIPYTGKLEALSEFSPSNIVTQSLKNDMAKGLNTGAAAAFTGCKIKYHPTGSVSNPGRTIATGGSATTAATRNIAVWDVKEIVDYLAETLFAPAFDGQDYICIGPRSSFRQIFDDDEFQKAAQYGDPSRLFDGEVGRYYGCRFITDNQALTAALGTTAYKGECVFFGFDPVVEAIAIEEQIRAKIPQDYGRDKGVAWYALMGWAEVWDTATAGEAKIVHVTST
jgi:N4-gp56 family major capsid protein